MRTSLLLLCALLIGCQATSLNEPPTIASESEYTTVLHKAEDLSRDGLQKINLDEELTAQDRSDLVEASVQFEALVKYHPNQFAPYLALGMIYRGLGNPVAAERNLRQCLVKIPSGETEAIRATRNEAHYQLSRSLFDQGEYESALGEASTAALGDRNNPNYMFGVASALAQLHQKDEAIKTLKAVLKLDPGHRRAQGLLKLLSRSGGA